jgi:CBS domain-containing protein
MRVGEFCNREVIVIGADESVKVAAELMRKHHVGDVVLVEERQGRRVPVGIITDRDLVVEIMVPELDPGELAARDIVTGSLATTHSEDSMLDALDLMRSKGVRRLPVVETDGSLAGIITVDDVMGLLTEMLGRLAGVVERQRAREVRQRP